MGAKSACAGDRQKRSGDGRWKLLTFALSINKSVTYTTPLLKTSGRSVNLVARAAMQFAMRADRLCPKNCLIVSSYARKGKYTLRLSKNASMKVIIRVECGRSGSLGSNSGLSSGGVAEEVSEGAGLGLEAAGTPSVTARLDRYG